MTSTPLKNIPLYDLHESLRCKQAPFAGYQMPLQYSSIKEEVQAVRENVGLFDVSHMGEFLVFGKEASLFLDHIVTNDVSQLPLHKAIYTPICYEHGGVIDDLIIYKLAPEIFLVCVNASNCEKDWNHFFHFFQNFSYKCQLENISDQCCLLALQGPKAKNLLQDLGYFTEHVPTYGILSSTLGDLHPDLFIQNTEFLIISRTGYTGEDGFELFGDAKTIRQLWEKLTLKGTLYSLRPCGLAARDVLRIEAGYPLYGNELNDEHTPFESGIGWTVKLKKKNDFLGKTFLQNHSPRWQLKKFSVPQVIPRSHYMIFNEQKDHIGSVTSGTFSPTLQKGIGLAKIDTASWEKNSVTSLQVREQIYPIEWHSSFLKK